MRTPRKLRVARNQAVGALLASTFVMAFASTVVAHAANCPLPADKPSLMAAGPVQASWSAAPALPLVGEPFVMHLTLCPASAQLVKVDAEMPDHRHGMNYKSSFTALGDGQWRVEGMVWHMAGRWLLKVDARLDGNLQRLTQSVVLK